MDPVDFAKGLRARQTANIGDALNRSAGTTALTVQAYTGSFGPSAPVIGTFDQQYVDELANTQRFEVMKTANEKFKGWLEDDTKTFADLPAALVVDNLPHWVDYSDALEDALQSSAGNLMTVQGKNILQMGQSVLSSVGAVGKVAYNDPTGLVYKLDVYTQIARGEQIDPATLSRNHVGKSIADDVRAFMTMTPDEQQAHMNAVTSEVLRRQDVMDEVRRTFQRYAKYQFANNYGRAVDLRDIDDLYGFVEFAANAGSNVVASAGLVALSFYLGSQAAPAAGVAAAFSTSALLESSEIVGRLAEEGRLNQYTAARAVAAGMLSGGVEMAVGAPATFMRGTSSRLFTEAMGKRAFRRLGRVAGRSFMEEGAQEALQAYIQQVGAEGIEGLAPDSEGMWEIINSAAMGALGGGMFGSAGSLRYSLQARRAAKGAMKADAFESTMNAVADTIKSIPEAGRTPEVVSEITGALGGADHQIFYQATDLADFADKNGIPLPQLLKNLSIGQRDFEAALSDGGPVATTMDRVVAHGFTLSSGSEFFIQNATTADMPFSPAQAKELKALLTEKRAEIQKQAEADALTPTRSAVYSYVKDQVIAAGKNEREAHALGVTWTAFFDTLSTYTSTPVDQLLSSYGIKIVRGAEATAPPGLQQGQTETSPFPDSAVQQKVYHRTSAQFEQFQLGGDRSGKAIWFSLDPTNLPSGRPSADNRTIEAFVDLQNPLMLDEFNLKEMQDRWAGGSKEFPFYLTDEARQSLLDAGFDGVIAEDVYGDGTTNELLVLDPSQISQDAATQAAAASVYMQTAAIEQVDQRVPLRTARGATYQGVVDDFTVENTSPDAPAKPLILNKTGANNAAAQTEALDVLHSRHPNPLASVEAWIAYVNDAFGTQRVMMPPWRTLDIVAQGPQAIVDELSSMPAKMQQSAKEGLETAAAIGRAYTDGNATPSDTAFLFLWSFLSRGVTPYVQEAAFLDVATKPEFADIVTQALRDGWTPALQKRYKRWAKSALPAGSPAKGTTHNLNAFGESFMRVMTTRTGNGPTGLETIHNMIIEGASSRDIRREFLRVGDRAGIDNKVVSFTLLLAGRDDVLVLDRIQMRNQMDDGRFGYNIYDDKVVDKKAQNGTGVARLSFGHKGLLYYEAMEDALAPIIDAAYTQMDRGKGSLGRYHWDSWVAASNQEVGHASLEGFARTLSGNPDGLTGAFVRQGKFGAYDYGFQYTVTENGGTAIRVAAPSGARYELPLSALGTGKPLHKSISAVINKLKKPYAKFYKPAAGTGKKEWTVPWTSLLSKEQADAYEEALRSNGTLFEASVIDTADPVGREGDPSAGAQVVQPRDAEGFILYQTATVRQGGEGQGRAGHEADAAAVVREADLVKLAEVDDPAFVQDFLTKDGWGVVTATLGLPDSQFYRDMKEQRPELYAIFERQNAERNIEQNAYLQSLLEGNGIPYIVLEGMYEGVSDGVSFLVLADEATVTKFGKQFRQDSVLTRKGLIYTTTVKADQPIMGEAMVGQAALEEPFYSVLPSGAAFSLPFDFEGTGAGVPVIPEGYTTVDGHPHLPINTRGKVELHHWSAKQRAKVDPAKAGTGPLQGVERKRGLKASFYGINPRPGLRSQGTGYVKENLGPVEHIVEVDPEQLYPYFENPLGLDYGDLDVTAVEAIKAAGYLGYYVTEDGTGRAPNGDVAVVFEALAVTRLAGSTVLNQPEVEGAYPILSPETVPTDSPAFKRWFGDSKVVDENGNPLVVYHGGAADVEVFDTSTVTSRGRGDEAGTYFTSDPNTASNYRTRPGGRVYAAYLSLRNPLDTTQAILEGQRDGLSFGDAKRRALEALDRDKHDGVIFQGDGLNPPEYVAFEPTQIKSVFNRGTFDPNDPRISEQRQPSGVQGQIEFPAGGVTPGSETVIRLFNADNPTTLLHESGHFFFEMYRVLAAAPNATPQIKAMWEKVNSGLGREAGDVSPLSTDHHEYLARSFEVWFMKGEAPSVGLRAVFRQFKNWLTRTYQAVQSMRGMKMNDDIVDFMERMLATEEEIALARDDHDLGPMFSERPIGMSDEGWQTYRDIAAKEEEEAEERLLKRVMKGLRKRHKQAVEDLLVERRAELMQSKAFRTVDKVTAESSKDMRLNRSQLVKLVGEDVVKRIDAIPVEGKYKFAVNGGGDIYDVADLLGYRDPGVMINDIVEFMDAWDAAPAQADEDHKQMFGDALTDGSLRAQAEAALHTDASTRRLALDMKTVKQMLDDEGADVPDAPTAEAMRALGKRRFADKKVVSANKPSVFLTQERKYNRIAREKLARLAGRAAGRRLAPTSLADLRAAYSAMQKAALNHVYYIEAKRLEDSLQALANREQRVRKAYSQKKLLEPYGDYLTALYEMFGLTKLPKGQLPRTVDLKVLVDSEASRTDGLDRTSELNPAESTIAKTREAALVRAAIHYNSFTVSEFEDLKDTLVNLEKVAREEMKILREGHEVSYRSIRADLEATLSTFDEKEFGISETDSERNAKVRGALVNSLKTVDTLLSELDRYTIGSFQKNLAIPVKQALARYTVRDQQSKNEIGEIFKRWMEGINVDEKVKVDELGGVVLKRRELIAMAQNAGNRLNWQRLIGDRRLGNFGDNTDARGRAVEAALRNHLSENEWHYVQDMWSYINGFWPEIAALERRLSGVTPQKIDEEIMVSGLPSFVKGGYYPIYYDSRLSASVTENDLNETLSNMRSGRATRAQTKNGHTKSRMEVVDKVLSYDITAPIRHVSSVLFDLEMREPVAVTYRLLNDKGMKELFQRKGLEANRRALVLWIQDVANADRSHVDGFNALLRHFRGGLSIAKMGLSYATIVQQPLGLTASTAVIGRGYTLNAVGKYVFNGMGRSSEAVQAMSNTMKERQATFERDYQWMMDSLDTDPVMSKWNRVRKFMTMAAFYGMQKAQYWTVDVPTWMAGYDRALAEGHVGQAAADVADLYLERAQGSGMLASRSAIERGTISETSRNSEFARLSTVFGSYMMSGKFNAAIQKVGYMRQNPSAGNIASTLVDLITMFSVETALSLLVTGRWPDEEKIEDWEGWGGYYGFMIWQTGATVMAGVPLLRDVVSAAEGFGGGGAQASAVESSVRLLKGTQTTAALLAGIEEDEGKYRRAVRDILQGAGVIAKLPTIQLERILTAIYEEDLSLRSDISPYDLLTGRRD